MKLNVKALAVTSGLFCGGGLFLATWWMIATGGASCDKTFIGRIYLGYDVSPVGSLVGLIWGLVDGLICGALFAVLYNLISAKYLKPK